MKFLNQLRAKIGDFWWYSLILFFASRLADFMNAFVGLWLVPKYVNPSELGAVMPITQFACLLALPVSIVATTFMKEVNTLASRGEFGQLKTLMRGVFICTGVLLIVSIIAMRLLMPVFLERIRVAEGSLGFIIIAASFIGCTAPIYQNALQALKKFRALSIINFIGAPVRLITMLVAMPFRPLSGYFVGQAATPAFNIAASIIALRKELSVKAAHYWSMPVVRRIGGLLIGISIYQIAITLNGLVEQTVLRQRLPELDSAAYYMASRFSEIATFVAITLTTTMFPYTAELSLRGKDTRPIVLKASLATTIPALFLALFFWIFGRQCLAILPHGDSYSQFYWAIPWMVGITTISAIHGFFISTEISAARFGFLKWWVPICLILPTALLLITGYGYFTAYLPASWTQFLAAHNFTSLKAMLWYFTIAAVVKTLFCTQYLYNRR